MDPSVAYGVAGAGWKIPPNATAPRPRQELEEKLLSERSTAEVRFDIQLLGWEEIDDAW